MDVSDFVSVTWLYDSGVYMLLHGERVVYVGQSKCVMRRIYEHDYISRRPKRQYPGSPKPMRYNGVKVCPLPLDQLDFIERELIAFYKPYYNIQHNPKPAIDILSLLPPPSAPPPPRPTLTYVRHL